MPPRPPPPRAASPATALLNQAVAHHQNGRLDQALALYRQILQHTPGQFDATHLMGVIALQHGDLAGAQALITQALASKPKDPAALNNLGTALLRAGRLDDARVQFERAVKAQPGFVDALSNLGSVLRQLGRVEESVAPLKRAFAGNARSAEIADLLGASLIDTGDSRAATAVFEAAVKARPGDARSWTHLAIARNATGNAARALEAADEALRLAPEAAKALDQRAQALGALGDVAGARRAHLEATRLAPDDAGLQHNFGTFLRAQGEFDEAAAHLRTAIRLDPGLTVAHEALVGTLVDGGRADEATRHGQAFAETNPNSAAALAMQATAQFALERVEEAMATYALAVAAPGAEASTFIGYGDTLMACGNAAAATKQFARAIELDGDSARARFSLAMSHLRPIYDDVAQMEASRRAFIRAIAELDAWCTPARAVAGARAVGSAQPFYLAYHPVDARPLLAPYGRLATRLLGAGVTTPKAAAAAPLAPLRARKLRVGIAAAHVRNHSVWNAITQGWVRYLDRTRFEVFVFQLERKCDAETARARDDAAHFIDAPVSLEGWASAIVEAELDVLIYPEIGMHPLTTRLASMRLAPLQATSWGQPLTSGLPTMDLFLGAQSLEPPQGAAHYTEKLVALPNLGVCVQALRPVAMAPDFARLGLSPTEPLLLCPGTPFKYTPQSDTVWAAIAARLQARGSGRLVFFRSHRAGMSTQIEQRMRREFAAAGVDHDRTVVWIPTLERGQFFGLMTRATAMLDTLGFSGFNTALQGLECDLPVVAFEGEFMRGRLASGALRQIGLDSLVATTHAEFADIAMRLVEDDAWRLGLKQEISSRRGVLFDDRAPIRALEEVLLAEARARIA